MDDVFVELHPVGHLVSRSKLRPSSCCAGATSWWRFSGCRPSSAITLQHFAAQVLGAVERRTGK